MWNINIDSVAVLFICVALHSLYKFSHFVCSWKTTVGLSDPTELQQTDFWIFRYVHRIILAWQYFCYYLVCISQTFFLLCLFIYFFWKCTRQQLSPLLSRNSAFILKVQNVSLRLDIAEFMMWARQLFTLFIAWKIPLNTDWFRFRVWSQ